MRVLRGLEELTKPLERSVLTIGNFDGMHLAHQQLLSQAGLFAARQGTPVVALTFEPHPLSIVAPQKVPPKLVSLEDKLALLAQYGAEITVVARSEPSLLGMEAERFVDEVIRQRFRPTHIIEGPSFGFGKGRRGNSELLRREAAKFGCEVHVVDPVRLTLEDHQAVMVSSSLIRELLQGCHVRRAAMCLGRMYSLTGHVVEGDQRGRGLGFPTANVGSIEQMIPGEGVYAGAAIVEQQKYDAAISIGKTPTFGERQTQVEVHLLDFSKNIYGQPFRVEFFRFLRSQRKFESAEALVTQLKIDVQAVRVSSSGDDAGNVNVERVKR